MSIRPLLIYVAGILLTAWIGGFLSGGLPWGIDDGVKRLMARSFSDSGGKSLLITAPPPADLTGEFFPIPPPYVERTEAGFQAIFPALWPALGGVFYTIFGPFGFYILPAGTFLLLLGLFSTILKKGKNSTTSFWALLIAASALLFYGLTFWEHALALIFLLPLFSAVLFRLNTRRNWMLTGLAFGIAIYLRPEAALLFPCLWFIPGSNIKNRLSQLLRLAGGALTSILAASLFERIFTGRWMPLQVPVNLGLAFDAAGFLDRLIGIFYFLINSPISLSIFAGGLVIILILALVLRNSYIPAFGLPLLSIISFIWAYCGSPAFGITASSQGLFFAFPWVAISLMTVKNDRRLNDPLFVLGWGYILLAYLLGPDQPGMHWGPRFLFPALLPLVLRSVQVLKQLPAKTSRVLMAVTATAAIFQASGSVLAIAERGETGRDVLATIEGTDSRVIILDRWHDGADLEPLWGELSLVWAKSPGNLEELLISLEESGIYHNIGWLRAGSEHEMIEYPIETISQQTLPDRAGWREDFLEIVLANTTDYRWGELYWHAAHRRAEENQFPEAHALLRKAIQLLPENADLHYDLAIFLGRSGLTAEAIAELGVTLRLNPEHEAARELWRQLDIP